MEFVCLNCEIYYDLMHVCSLSHSLQVNRSTELARSCVVCLALVALLTELVYFETCVHPALNDKINGCWIKSQSEYNYREKD